MLILTSISKAQCTKCGERRLVIYVAHADLRKDRLCLKCLGAFLEEKFNSVDERKEG